MSLVISFVMFMHNMRLNIKLKSVNNGIISQKGLEKNAKSVVLY